MRRFLTLILMLPVVFCIAEEMPRQSVFSGCSGGMLLHGGYLYESSAPNLSLPTHHGFTYGIGGAMRICLWDHLRIGGEGFVSNENMQLSSLSPYVEKGSYIRNGWGGFLADAYWKTDKLWWYLGGTIGGGSCKSLYLLDGNQIDWLPEDNAIYNKTPYFLVDPFVGMEYLITPRVHLALKLDWILAVHDNSFFLPTGPRLYIGFFFTHSVRSTAKLR